MQLKTELLQLNGRLRSKETIIQETQAKTHILKTQIATMKANIYGLKDFIQHPDKLKQQVKVNQILK